MDRVIVDTSAWIESFRPQGESKLKEAVKQLISDGRVLLPGLIKAEILRGAKTLKEYKMLDELLDSLVYLQVEDSFWKRLAKFSFDLLRKGVTVPLTDTYIALLAIDNDVPLLHRDTHFDLIGRESRLRVLQTQ